MSEEHHHNHHHHHSSSSTSHHHHHSSTHTHHSSTHSHQPAASDSEDEDQRPQYALPADTYHHLLSKEASSTLKKVVKYSPSSSLHKETPHCELCTTAVAVVYCEECQMYLCVQVWIFLICIHSFD